MDEIIIPLTEDQIRKHLCQLSICTLSDLLDIDESVLCRFRAGKAGVNGKTMLKLINYLYLNKLFLNPTYYKIKLL